MESLKYLKSVLNTFKPEETKTLEKFILFQIEPEDEQKSKSATLLRLLLSENNFTANEIQKTIYGTANYSAFNKLVNRLKEKALEVILFNSSLEKGYYADRSKIVFQLRKKLMQIDLLILKGMRFKMTDEINLIVRKAEEYEIYEVLVSILYTKQRFQTVGRSIKKAVALKEEIESAEFKWKTLNTAQAEFNEMLSVISSSTDQQSYQHRLEDTIFHLQKSYSLTGSPTIGYYYYLLQVEKAQFAKDYALADKYLETLVLIIRENKSVYNRNRLGTALLNQANNSMLRHDFKATLLKLDNLEEYFIGLPVSLSILYETRFLGHYFNSNLMEAFESMKELKKIIHFTNSKFLTNKVKFYSACLEFINGNYPAALERFDECEEIDQDKEGWNIVKRIMIILCRIELKDYESVDLNLGSMDKFIKRMLKTRNIKERYLIIVRILRKLINENFDFDKVYNSRRKYFDLLGSDDAMYSWQIMSPELILFETWFRCKMRGAGYNHEQALVGVRKIA